MSELIRADDGRWHAMLARCPHDFYHLPGYVALTARWEGGEPAAFLVEAGSCRLLLPLLIRPLPPGSPVAGQDATSPYGYPGPIWNPDAAPGDVVEALRRCADLGAEVGLVSSFVRLHPVLDDGEAAARLDDPRVRLVDHGPTVGIDLTADDAATDEAVRQSIRANVRKLRAHGFTVRRDEPGDLEAFQAIYLDTMERLGSSAFYRYGPGYFAELQRQLGHHFHLFAAVAPSGEVASAGIFTAVDGVLQEHLAGTASAYLPASPSKLLIVEVRDWGRRTGARVLHVGGGLGAREDSLYAFKSGFGALRFRFRSLQIVHRPDAFHALVPPALRSLPAENTVSFFPPYRDTRAA